MAASRPPRNEHDDSNERGANPGDPPMAGPYFKTATGA